MFQIGQGLVFGLEAKIFFRGVENGRGAAVELRHREHALER